MALPDVPDGTIINADDHWNPLVHLLNANETNVAKANSTASGAVTTANAAKTSAASATTTANNANTKADQLKTRVDAVAAPGAWQKVTLQNGWSNRTGGNYALSVRTLPNNMCQLVGTIIGGTTSGGTTLTTLPADCRPTVGTVSLMSDNGGTPRALNIKPTGEVSIFAVSSVNTTAVLVIDCTFTASGPEVTA